MNKLLKQLRRKFKVVTEKYKEKLIMTSEEAIESIAIDIF